MSPSPPRLGRVRGRRTFATLRRDGTRHRSGPIVITALVDDQLPGASVGYAIPKAVGSAVARNRLRRRLRALTPHLGLEPGTYLVSARPAAAELSFDELAAHLRKACGR